ncbi:MAG: hypothetical protein HY047_15350 [Acidobacteria bacterium]|nr:hypothetical protein [Acidobacteriota bacterium]
MNRLRAIAVAAIGLVAFVRPALAHPPGTTTVDLVLHDGRFNASITIDADALRLKPAALQRPIVDLAGIAFDGVSVTPAVETTTSPDGQTTVVTLSGDVPPDATSVTWKSSLVYGAYLLTIRDGGDAPRAQWLQGLQPSTPYALRSSHDVRSRNNILFALALSASALLLPRAVKR